MQLSRSQPVRSSKHLQVNWAPPAVTSWVTMATLTPPQSGAELTCLAPYISQHSLLSVHWILPSQAHSFLFCFLNKTDEITRIKIESPGIAEHRHLCWLMIPMKMFTAGWLKAAPHENHHFAACVGWSENNTQNPPCTMPCTIAWSSPVARCQSHHYLNCLENKVSLPLSFVSSDLEYTDNGQVGQCLSSDSLRVTLPHRLVWL